MSKTIDNILVVGMGKVGSLVGTLLDQTGFSVTGMDAREVSLGFPTITGDMTSAAELGAALKKVDAVVSCLPYHLNREVAVAAHEAGIHYFDLTEDVPTTKATLELSKTSKGLMAPQCGLAPGFIGIVGSHLTNAFSQLREINLRVGALPQNPTGLLGYAFNWSPEGVVNEYLNDCEVIQNGEPNLSRRWAHWRPSSLMVSSLKPLPHPVDLEPCVKHSRGVLTNSTTRPCVMWDIAS